MRAPNGSTTFEHFISIRPRTRSWTRPDEKQKLRSFYPTCHGRARKIRRNLFKQLWFAFAWNMLAYASFAAYDRKHFMRQPHSRWEKKPSTAFELGIPTAFILALQRWKKITFAEIPADWNFPYSGKGFNFCRAKWFAKLPDAHSRSHAPAIGEGARNSFSTTVRSIY